jgi:tetratricopeptide (TPR) repeat protein
MGRRSRAGRRGGAARAAAAGSAAVPPRVVGPAGARPARRASSLGLLLFLVLFLVALLAAGGLWYARGRKEEPPPPVPAAAASREPVLDPRSMAFPALTPEKAEKLRQAIERHLLALEAYSRNDRAAGNGYGAAALGLYQEAEALIPDLGQLHHELVVDSYQRGDLRGAVLEARRWLERFPDSQSHLEILGTAEYLKGDLAGAAEHLSRAAALSPRSVKLQRQLQRVYSGQGRKEPALAAADAALRLIGYPAVSFWSHPEAEETVRAALSTYHRFYEYAGLLPIAETLLARHPDDPQGLMAAGVARRQLGDYAGAEKLLERMADDPENGDEVRFELGIALLKQGRPREAAGALAKLLRRSPHFGRAYFQLGQCLTRLRRAEEAEPMFRMSRNLAPSDRELRREIEMRGVGKPAEARRARAKALALRGQFREAEAVLRDPALADNPGAAVFLAEFLVDCLRGREAEEAIRGAARILGEAHPDVRGWRGQALALMGRPREAAAVLEPVAAARLPSSPWPRALGLILLDDLADPAAAIPWLERALSDPPQPAEVSALARARLEAGQPAEALKLLRPVSRAEFDWEEEVRFPLALSILRAASAERSEAADLVAGAPAGARQGRLYHLTLAQLLEGSADPAERERAKAERKEAERLRELEDRWRKVRAEVALLSWPEAGEPLVRAAAIQREMGDRAGALRMARLAAAARPDSPEANRLLSQALDDPGEVFYRLLAVRSWRRAAPGDREAARAEAEAEKAIQF